MKTHATFPHESTNSALLRRALRAGGWLAAAGLLAACSGQATVGSDEAAAGDEPTGEAKGADSTPPAAPHGRGVGTVPARTTCPAGQVLDVDGLCYPACASGYTGVGPVCWDSCPSGYTDTGALCTYSGALVIGCTSTYPCQCPANYHPAIAAAISLTCDFGGTVTIPKSSYGRGAGTVAGATCPAGQVLDVGGLCYPACASGYTGVGPLCWPAVSNVTAISPDACDALYDPDLSKSAKQLGSTLTFGFGAGVAAGVTGSAEAGVAYGQNGEFECYYSLCGGIVTNTGISAWGSFGSFTAFEHVAEDDSVVSGAVGVELPEVVGVSVGVSTFYDTSGLLVGAAGSLSVDVGASSPITIGATYCHTAFFPPPPPPPPSGCGLVQPGQGLTAGQTYSSCDGVYTLAMQTDGNLVLYHNGKGALWATGTNGKDGLNAVMQADGNFVLYDIHDQPLWASGTNGHGGASLAVQEDGNLVVYAPGNMPLWASGTNGK